MHFFCIINSRSNVSDDFDVLDFRMMPEMRLRKQYRNVNQARASSDYSSSVHRICTLYFYLVAFILHGCHVGCFSRIFS